MRHNGHRVIKITRSASSMFCVKYSEVNEKIVSDTNLNSVFRNKWIDLGKSHGYEIEIVEFHIECEEAIRRDRLRLNPVGEKVISQQFNRWCEYTTHQLESNQ